MNKADEQVAADAIAAVVRLDANGRHSDAMRLLKTVNPQTVAFCNFVLSDHPIIKRILRKASVFRRVAVCSRSVKRLFRRSEA